MYERLWLGAILALGYLLYRLWSARDRRRSAAMRSLADDISALGDDAVPASLHPVIDPDVCIGSGACVRACPEHDVIGVVNGRVQLVNPLACVGHGACMAACPVEAITLVFGTAKRGIDLPVISPHFETNLRGVYLVGELSGMGLIRNSIEQGRQAAAAIVAGGQRAGDGALDAVVVGAGPAGISTALHLGQAGLSVEVLEQEDYGGAIKHFPRAKIVMTGGFELPGLGKVRRRTLSKEALLELWESVRKSSGLRVVTGVKVSALSPDAAGGWTVGAEGLERRARHVVLALGRRGSPRKLGVPGEDQAHVHYSMVEPGAFDGKRVLVVGGGNAAADCAIGLADRGRALSVALSYRRAELARLRHSVRQSLDDHIKAGRVRFLACTQLVRVGQGDVTIAKTEGAKTEETTPTDAIIVQIGGTSPTELLGKFGVQTAQKRGER